jgi:hypothetical protein
MNYTFKINQKKYFIIFFILYLILINNSLKAQIIPQALIVKKEVYSATSIFADAQFKFNYNNNSPRIRSDFSFNFSNNTPYTFQFEFGIFDETYGIADYQIPLIGFTNDLLNTDKAIIMYSFKQKYTLLGYNNYRVDDNVMHHVLNSNVDLNRSKTQYGKPYEGYKSAVITTTYDGSRWKTYKNGILIDEIVNTSTWNGSGNLIIGNDRISNSFANLYLYFDEIRFWNRALSADELSKNWNKPLQGNETGLKLYYNFNDQGYPASNNLDIDNRKITYLNDLTASKNKGIFINAGLYGYYNNFYRRISDTYNSTLFNPIFRFDANNEDCYPGSGNNNNNPTIGTVYNLNEFNNNLLFYSNAYYNQIVSPNHHGDWGRSFGIYNIYGKSKFNTGIEGDMSITIEAWVKFNTLNNSSLVSIGENFDGNQFELAILNNKLILGLGGNNKLISSTSLIQNKWYHIVCTYENWQYNIYINGINERKGWYVGPPPYLSFTENDVLVPLNIVNTPLYIGTSQKPFNGIIGILNLYNISLSPTEVLSKYNSTKSRFGY